MSKVLRIAMSRAGHFLPMIVLLMIPSGLLNGFAVWLGFRSAVLTTDSSTGDMGFSNPDATAGNYWLMAGSVLLTMLAWLYLTLAVAHQANGVAEEQPQPWSASMAEALALFPRGLLATAPLFGAVTGIYLVVGIGLVAAPGLAVLVVLAAFVLLPWLAVRLTLAQVSAGVAPPGERPVALSWSLTRHRFWAMSGRMAILLLITMALSLLASFLAAPFTALAGGGGAPIEPGAEVIEFSELLGDNPAVFLIGQLFSAIGSGASTVMWAIGLTLIYRSLSGPVNRGDDDHDVDVVGS